VSHGAAEPSVAESMRAALGCPRELQPKEKSASGNASDNDDDDAKTDSSAAPAGTDEANDELVTKVSFSCSSSSYQLPTHGSFSPPPRHVKSSVFFISFFFDLL